MKPENQRNIDYLFASKNVKPKDNLDDSAMQKAALLFDFDINDDFKDATATQKNALIEIACSNSKGRMFLPNHLRKKLIHKIVAENQLNQLINKHNLSNDYTNILSKVANDEPIDIINLNSRDLFYLHKLSAILPEKITEVKVRNIKFELERRQFLKHFTTLTQNFAGRKEEYNRLKSYVDWLPNSSVIQQVESKFRNLINWHDKNPLLITGIGGIGKSTLVSKFILDHLKELKGQQKLPFVFIDFDLIGFSISEPMNIFIEALRQLSLQFPENRKQFNLVSKYIADKIGSGTNAYRGSSDGSRSVMLDEIKEVVPNYETAIASINTPILVVFDSFEELQYRASSTELANFFSTIKQVAEHLPRIRPVFVGRANINGENYNLSFEDVPLEHFDAASADAILEKYGIKDKAVRTKVFKKFGGNPLTLQLAANILLKKDESVFHLKTKNLFSKKEESKIQEQLVGRMLDHIKGSKARTISVPGMVIRKINPEIIREVLAAPLELGEIDNLESIAIYNELEREAFLLAKSHQHKEFVFRQDLRLVCEEMINRNYKNVVEAIHENAIQYYKNKTAPEDKAEYFFHWLKSGKDPNKLSKEDFAEIRIFIENSINELPDSAQLHINKLIGGQVKQQIIDESELLEWESYHSAIILEAFKGELERLQYYETELKKRKERTYTTQLPIVEATLYQRLGKLEESNQLIDKTLAKLENSNLNLLSYNTSELLFIKAQNCEYQQEYEIALKVALSIVQNSKVGIDVLLKHKLNFLIERLTGRISDNGNKYIAPSNIKLFYRTIEKYKNPVEINWLYIFSKLFKYSNFSYANEKNFKLNFEKIKTQVKSFKELESFSYNHLDSFYYDIAMPAVLDIAIKDMMYVMEVESKLKKF